VLPDALFNGLFQPTPGAGGQKIYLFFSLELYAIWIIALLALAKASLCLITPNSQLKAHNSKLTAHSSQLTAWNLQLRATKNSSG
jgi:hypothetical protein